MNPTTDRAELDAALASRAEARTRLQAAEAALERAQRVTRESAAEAERRAGAKRAADQVHVSAVESWIAGGCIGDRPARLDDPRLTAADERARSEHEVIATALKSLEAARERAQADLAEAENRTRAAVTAILLADARRIAADVIELEQKAVDLRLDLIGIVDHPFVIQKHGGLNLPPEIMAGLHPPKPTPNSGFALPRYTDELLAIDASRVAVARQRCIERADALLNTPAEADASGRHATAA